MRMLIFADLHCNKKAIKELINKARKADIIVCAGDISNFGSDWKTAAKLLAKANKEMLIIPSNHDSEEDISKMSKQFSYVRNIHKKMYRIENIVFFGYGNHGFSLREADMERTAIKLLNKANLEKGDKLIFVTHAPPYDTKLDYLRWLNGHRGCLSTRIIIDKYKPALVVSGHFHETAGRHQKLGKSLLVNPGPFGKLIEV